MGVSRDNIVGALHHGLIRLYFDYSFVPSVSSDGGNSSLSRGLLFVAVAVSPRCSGSAALLYYSEVFALGTRRSTVSASVLPNSCRRLPLSCYVRRASDEVAG